MRDVCATVRLQFHQGFTFMDAIPLVAYFAKLGISHIYSSPILKARPGSTYGYDVIDPTQVNPELGGELALEKLAEELHRHEMGLMVDFVPNHMAVGGAFNPWWLDVLEWGSQSPYARFFDIQWNSTDPLLQGQLLSPVLRAGYGEVLTAGEITLHFNPETGKFYAQHFDHQLPLYPPTYNELLSQTNSTSLQELGRKFLALEKSPSKWEQAHQLQYALSELARQNNNIQEISKALQYFSVNENVKDLTPAEQYKDSHVKQLHKLLEQQHYRLADWRTAADDINWRRFFDINELGALRAERNDVFEATHAKIFNLIERGLIDGLRIDHIDGLANPRAYCRKLRRRTESLLAQAHDSNSPAHFPIFVEKILAENELVPRNWEVDGTTGYEFMNQVSLLQHDSANAEMLTNFWSEETGRSSLFIDEVIEARKLILSTSLTSDFETVAQGLLLIARSELATRDITLGAIRRALFELIVHFPVYRTYSRACARSAQDEVYFQQALEGARMVLAESEWSLLDYLDSWLGGQPLFELPQGAMRKLRYRTLARFQQLTSPIAAKAVEDTACYRSGILLSRNDVGFNPEIFSGSCADFHSFCRTQAAEAPNTMLTTATHDHKRGEDTRARIAVLSECAPWFIAKVKHWMSLAAPLRQLIDGEVAPSTADEIMLYQTLLGSWPLDWNSQDSQATNDYLERLQSWQEKAVREAKLRSNWSTPNTAYESACHNFLESLFTAKETIHLRNDIAAAAMEIAPAGAINSLMQTLLRMTAPGFPDLYQGREYWDFSLVDPDNRRPINFTPRINSLNDSISEMDEKINQWRDGRIKQHLVAHTLNFRCNHSDLFSKGSYLPLTVTGQESENVIAFARYYGEETAIIIVPRLVAHLLVGQPTPYIPPERWGNTQVTLPDNLISVPLAGLFSRAPILMEDSQVKLQDVFTDFPVNILFKQS